MTSPWVEPYELAGPWATLLSGAGSWLLPTLAFLAGVAAAAALVYVYVKELVPPPFFGLKPPKIPGIEEKQIIWAPFGVAALFITIMLLTTMSLSCSGFGGAAFSSASLEMWQASDALTDAILKAQTVNTSAATVEDDLKRLFSDCPASIQHMLGTSVSKAAADISEARREASLSAASLQELPKLAQAAAGQLGALEGALPIFVGIALFIVVLLCGTVALLLVATKNAPLSRVLNKKAGPHVLGLLLPACGAAATFLLCAVAVAEFFNAHQTISFCGAAGGPDTAVLSHIEESAGKVSDTYSLADHYLAGQGGNPAITHLGLSRQALSSCTSWLTQYEYPLQTTCPQWDPGRVHSHLLDLEGVLNETELLLQPSMVYGSYKAAVHEYACTGGSEGMASLAMQQVILGVVCVPLLVLTAGWLQESLQTDGAAYQKLDKAKAADGTSDDEGSKEEDFNSLYYIVYAFSVIVFIVGLWMYLIPQPGVVRPVTGTLLFACGIFLMLNSDLIVTYVRLHEQVGRFEKNNERFENSLKQQALEVRKLQTAAKGFEEIDRKFGGDVKRAMKEVKQLETSSRANIGMCTKELCKLYFDLDKDHKIDEGKELSDSLDALATTFGSIIKDLRKQRIPKLQQALSDHPNFKRDKAVSIDTFAEAFEVSMFAHDPNQIPQAVNGIMDVSDARKSNPFTDPFAKKGKGP
eukprot:TRINITY_DN62739_c0_g1_i1.p1 TRINITY_DN62739_c0_g1~~TRINITY_DN62739_c0_g1_i1.p1  ORF type:complete len:710 (+),score=151.63 TRINITY_DN62739_c0_g1_i1:43-2130(+)